MVGKLGQPSRTQRQRRCVLDTQLKVEKKMLHAARQASKRLSGCNVRQRWRRLQPNTCVTFMVRMSILGQTTFWLNGFKLSLFLSRMRQLCWFFCPLPASKISPPQLRSWETQRYLLAMNLEPKAEIKSATRVSGGPATPRKGPPKFKQRQTRQFKSKPPKKGVQGWVLGRSALTSQSQTSVMVLACESNCLWSHWQIWWWHPWNGGLRHRWVHLRFFHVFPSRLVQQSECLLCFVVDITVICPWEAFNHLELHELAQYGIIWASTAPPSGLALTIGHLNHLPQVPSSSSWMEL